VKTGSGIFHQGESCVLPRNYTLAAEWYLSLAAGGTSLELQRSEDRNIKQLGQGIPLLICTNYQRLCTMMCYYRWNRTKRPSP